jgi:hypothetical protein
MADLEKKKLQYEQAERELKGQEHQHMLGVVPNYNTVNSGSALPLNAGQKFELALHSTINPFQCVTASLNAGLSQVEDEFPEYGQGVKGYAKRYGAAYADSVDGTIIGNAIFPVLLHQDPRYFRMGTGSLRRRILYSVATMVICKGDNGKWQPNYSNVLGNIASGGISNLYYPASDRGISLTFERAFTVTAEGAIGTLVVEFYPVVQKNFSKKDKTPSRSVPETQS